MSVIVVSDVHLGEKNTFEHNYFSNFIDWLAALEKNGSFIADGKRLAPPEKLILLGDILEMWDPKDDEMKNTFMKSVEPLGKLAVLKCEKIYVMGNHDEDIADNLEEIIINTDEGNKTIRRSTFHINSDFSMIDRHYPENPHDKEKGFLEIGKRKYFFLHGQQFDKLFLSVGPLANVPTYMAKASNMLMKFFPPKGWLIVALFAAFGAAYVKWGDDRIWGLMVASFILSIPRLFTYFQDTVWANVRGFVEDKPKYQDVATLIKKNYYVYDKDKTGKDVNFVFGHTHIPEIHSHKFKENGETCKMLFVNSGSWVPEEKYVHNTFVYLDEVGTYIFKWETSGDLKLYQSDLI